MKLKFLAFPLLLLASSLGLAVADDGTGPIYRIPDAPAMPVRADPPVPAPAAEKYARGLVLPDAEAVAKAHSDAYKRHANRVQRLPRASPATFDCRTLGWDGPMLDQGNCGSCWDVATCDTISNAYRKAGYTDPVVKISPQYILDQCGPRNGGCSGDWGTTVLNAAKSQGIPTEADYGPYTARQGTCKFKAGTKLWRITDYGFCTERQSSGMSTTQDIKNCIASFGVVCTAVAANSDWDNYRGGVMPFRNLGANSVNHEVQISGWDDSKVAQGTSNKGAFLVKNQWGKSWGEDGYCWIAYGSHRIGTECAWVTVAELPPVPPDPNPVPPDPNPPEPGPTPPTPTPGAPFTGKIALIQQYKDGVKVGEPLTYVEFPTAPAPPMPQPTPTPTPVPPQPMPAPPAPAPVAPVCYGPDCYTAPTYYYVTRPRRVLGIWYR